MRPTMIRAVLASLTLLTPSAKIWHYKSFALKINEHRIITIFQ